MMKGAVLVRVVGLAAIVVCSGTIGTGAVRVAAQAASPWIGVWNIDLAKSSYDLKSPPFKRQTCTIQPWEDGLRISYDIVGVRGGMTHLEWTGKFDGEDYAVEGMDSDMTNAYRRIDDRAYDIVVKLEGQTAAVARSTLSADGRTITTINGPTTTVFEKQGQ